jgi:hypothetical protein
MFKSTAHTYTGGHGGITFSVPRHHVDLINHASRWDVIAFADTIDLGEPWRDTTQMSEKIQGNTIVAMFYEVPLVDVSVMRTDEITLRCFLLQQATSVPFRVSGEESRGCLPEKTREETREPCLR